MSRRLSEKSLRMILFGGILVLLMIWIRSELLLKLLLLSSIVFICFLIYPYASVKIAALRKKLFGSLYGYRNLNLSLTGERLVEIADSLQSLAEGFRQRVPMTEVERDTNRWMEESRGIIAEQLSEVAVAVRKSSHILCGREEFAELQRQAVVNFLHAEHVQVKEIALFLDRESGRELRMVAKMRRGVCAMTRVLAEQISMLLDIPMLSSEENRNVVGKEYAEYIFYEAPRYHVLTGVARCVREDGACSGDNYSFLRSGRKDAVMVLADGMGSGIEAGRDSTMVVELLEQLLSAGFEEASVVRLLNAVLMLRSPQVKFTTLDMGIINLYTGNCEFVKAGAATTFIKRKNWVETIASTSVPLGFIDRVECETKHKKLYHDDYIIMLSDGALDCIGVPEKEEYLERLIADMTEKSPQEMAKQLMEGIADSPGYTAKDDITILVAGVFAV